MIDGELEMIKRIYRLRRLLVSRNVAVENVLQLCACFKVSREQLLEIASSEDQRRSELVRTLWAVPEL